MSRLTLLPLLFVVATATAAEPPKNIVLILADDLGWSDTTLYGKTSLYETPNIQRLAVRGMTFSNAYAAAPICSPTRASILTGRNPARLGFTTPAGHVPEVRLDPIASENGPPHQKCTNVKSATRLDPSQPTLGQLLKDAGYATAHFGKWHLGLEPYSPLEFGFDVDIPHWHGPGPKTGYLAPWNYPNLEEKTPGEHIEDRMAEEAVAWLKKRDRTKPFYMNYWQFSVHAPFGAKPELIDRYRKTIDLDSAQRSSTYAAMVHSLDDAVGSLLDAFDAEGIADETVIVFYSDNGGNIHCGLEETDASGENYITAITSNRPLRGGKGNIREGGIRVPAVVVWPGVTEPGSRSDTRIQSTDLYPTILRMLDVKRPTDYVIDGVDFASALRGEEMDRGPMFTLVPSHGNTPEWLPPAMAVHYGDWKLVRIFHYGEAGEHDYRLYNLREDIGEQHNLAATHPEMVRSLDRLIEEYIAEADVVVPLPNPNFDPAKFDPSQIGVQAGGLKMPPGAASKSNDPPATVTTPQMLGWIAKGCDVSVQPDSLQIAAAGRQPFLANAKLRATGPVELRLRIRAGRNGTGRLQWRTEDQTGFPATGQTASFGVRGGDWQELSVPLAVEGRLVQLRLFPPVQKQPVEIDWIEIAPIGGNDKDRQRWDFKQPPEKKSVRGTSKVNDSAPDSEGQPSDEELKVRVTAGRPSFVFMFADDLGYRDLACYGHPYANTPAIDQLASEGTRFTQAYAAGQTCNPSRTGIMIGIGVYRFDKRTDDFGFGERTTVTELLKNNGYATGHFGKWHIGMDRSNGVYGIDENNPGGKKVILSPDGRDTPIYAAAIDFIKRNKDRPFYVNIWGFTTHSPVVSAPNLLEEFSCVIVDRDDFSDYMHPVFDDSIELGGDLDQSMRHYLANVYALDRNVQSVLEVLDELGLRENTVVVFSSDQGPQRPRGIGANATGPNAKGEYKEHDENMLGDTGEFRGNKGTVRDGGLRVPFIIRWPSRVKAGVVDTENVIAGVDWLPSICSLAGVTSVPDDLDGEDVSDIWLGAARKRQKPLYWNGASGPATRDGHWKYYLGEKGEELYDILKDPAEAENLAEQCPEVAARLKEKVLGWQAQLPKKVLRTGNYRHQYY